MADYTTTTYPQVESPSKNVQARKLELQSEWGDLVRNQQALAEKAILQERELKNLQRADLQNTLQYQIQEKQNAKRNENINAKQLDYEVSQARKQDYDQYLAMMKGNQLEQKKYLANDYSKHLVEREEEKRRKFEQEKLMDQRTVVDALDSLQREKLMKDRQREEYKLAAQQLVREKEEQKRMEQERIAREREDQRRLMEENAYRIQAKDSNYRQYYQRVDDQQRNMQATHDRIVGEQARTKDRKIDDFIARGVEEARLKAEREEYERQVKKQEQMRSMKESIQSKMQEHELQKRVEKESYNKKVEELMKQNIAIQDHQNQMKQYKQNQISDYAQTLQYQMREQEEAKKRQQAIMTENEKKMMFGGSNGLVPGVKSSHVDSLVSPHLRTAHLINQIGAGGQSPTNQTQYTIQSPTVLNKSNLNTSSSAYGSMYARADLGAGTGAPANIPGTGSYASPKFQSHFNATPVQDYTRHASHNPITNPMPANKGANPYISNSQRESNPNNRSGAATRNFF